MRLICTFLFISFITSFAKSQDCNGTRYTNEIFSVEFQAGIPYGEGLQPTLFNPQATQTLFLDVYEPENDTMAARPLIIWAFGGAFVLGSRLSPDIVSLSNSFAARGYVNASIDYRLSTDLIINSSTENAYKAVMKASHDMAAAIRFFYKDAATINQFRIDTTKIYIGGVSAGALASLHVAHLDELNEVPAVLYNEFIANGDFTGNSGNAGYSQDIAGVISLSGAIGDTAWIDNIDLPIVSMHGTEDNIVPYGSDYVDIIGINLPVDGSASIHEKLDLIGEENAFYTFNGAGHTPFVGNTAYMDTTVQFVQDFLYAQVCPVVSNITTIPGNTALEIIDIFPNPTENIFNLTLDVSKQGIYNVVLYNTMGQEVYYQQVFWDDGAQTSSIDLSQVTNGVYYLSINKGSSSWMHKIIKI